VARAARVSRRRRVARRWAAAGLTAAAALTGVLVLPRAPSPSGRGAPSRSPAAVFSVTAAPGQQLMVLHPANPDIVVVWYLSSRRPS
jgi:hypothetical protein